MFACRDLFTRVISQEGSGDITKFETSSRKYDKLLVHLAYYWELSKIDVLDFMEKSLILYDGDVEVCI